MVPLSNRSDRLSKSIQENGSVQMTAGGYDENPSTSSQKADRVKKRREREREREREKVSNILDYTACNALCKRGPQIDIPFWLLFSLNAFDLTKRLL